MPTAAPASNPVARPANPVVVIPARMASVRLPGKPLADILGAPMIVHVLRRAMEAEIGPVVVACAEPEIARAVEAAGGTAVLTRPDHPSGSDRIFEALQLIDPEGRHDAVVNVQGDLPTIEPESVRAAFAPLADPEVDIATLVAEITREEERTNPNVVKAVLELPAGARQGRALYFTRATAPTGDGPLYHHIGLYAYRRAALERFVSLPPSVLEQRERLEQLRALSNGMRIDAAVVDAVPLGVDTPADLERACALLAGRKAG
ncbi:3-deoxy-manno-octulosonate cytidylyltransferase [Azospirillum sp. TSA6c]|uniref:3-deoxy-manno-octulosonate cytidylyltransferase n=1 Tax=unclassified Azospirillum TaxID=2630922 RepID=UPI000D609C99|nr:3-deoxy-manno-octulosonate cytidylyltransferase [Azospirillum sp. TSA6c]PWC50747.1 3-deoxy-manno-octulosonate cytidylyltransferase [Azospirillum sp. TSA6c]